MSKVSIEAFNAIIGSELPSAAESGIYLQSIEHGEAELVLPYSANSLRPGGTIAGPFMMLLADVWHIPTLASLVVIAVVLTATVLLSLRVESDPSRSSETGVES